MSTLLEKIAAKKAAALAATTVEEPVITVDNTPPAVAPMSFAEKMALKKAQHEAEKAQPEPTQATASTFSPELAPAKVEAPSIIESVKEAEEVNLSEVPVEVQQAYVDIKSKIDKLADMSEMNLKEAMTDLKKALLQNPQACYLILPQDIGQMVVALRAIRGEALVEAASDKPKGPKKTKSSKPLTAEEIAQAFDEL